jgi:hypothetical protein
MAPLTLKKRSPRLGSDGTIVEQDAFASSVDRARRAAVEC